MAEENSRFAVVRVTGDNMAARSAEARGDYKNAKIARTPGGIERQEAEGQADMVAAARLPCSLRPSRQAFEAVGFRMSAEIDGKNLFFRTCAPPPGWTLRADPRHSMHSSWYDAQGRKRADQFYKAAFYDERADCHLIHRYRVDYLLHQRSPDYPPSDVPEGYYAYAIVDGATGEILARSENVADGDYKTGDAANDGLTRQLAERFPLYADPTQYWDDPS